MGARSAAALPPGSTKFNPFLSFACASDDNAHWEASGRFVEPIGHKVLATECHDQDDDE